ncbi:MAG: DUF5677 domain-containing protein [Thermodesulfobacteriota bacterium]|nr:DUF5677 domain-containing protein [Thermodesulfobacteriota bacterium]
MEITSVMTNPERNLPILKNYIDSLISLSCEILSFLPRIDKSDHMAFMALCFASSQHDRLKAIKLLVDAGLCMDAGQIARSMLEGMCYLIWAKKEPSERPLLWLEYAYVQDFKAIQIKEKWKGAPDPAYKKKVEDGIRATGTKYYTSKNLEKFQKGDPLPDDPYVSKWYENELDGKTIRKVFKEIMVEQLYDIAYADTSGWLHWNITTLEYTLHYEGDTINYCSADPHTACIALSTGFQALDRSLQILDAHLKLGFEERLQELKFKFNQALK